jgi:hypothetical protein
MRMTSFRVDQHARRDALVLAHEPKQDVLRADVVMAQGQRLAQRQLEHLLRARRERDLLRGHLVRRAVARDAQDLGADALDVDVERLQDAGRNTLLLTKQAEQDVLRADGVVPESSRLFLRETDDLAGPFGETLEHAGPSCGPWCG